MKKNAILNISSTQFNHDQDENPNINIKVCGDFYKKNNIFYISYYDSLSSSDDKYKTLIKIEENCSTIRKYGKHKTTIIIDPNSTTICKYYNTYGFLVLEISESKIINKLNNNGGYLQLSYDINIDGNYICKNILNIEVDIVNLDVNN